MFGGEGSQEGTCVYDPWENTWTRMRPPVEPEFRSGGNMAYDARQRVHVLFGSQFSDDPHTWIYDLRSNVWRDARPPLSGGGRPVLLHRRDGLGELAQRLDQRVAHRRLRNLLTP